MRQIKQRKTKCKQNRKQKPFKTKIKSHNKNKTLKNKIRHKNKHLQKINSQQKQTKNVIQIWYNKQLDKSKCKQLTLDQKCSRPAKTNCRFSYSTHNYKCTATTTKTIQLSSSTAHLLHCLSLRPVCHVQSVQSRPLVIHLYLHCTVTADHRGTYQIPENQTHQLNQRT